MIDDLEAEWTPVERRLSQFIDHAAELLEDPDLPDEAVAAIRRLHDRLVRIAEQRYT